MSKEICFKCQAYSGASCSTSHKEWVASTGNAFRPPKKRDTRAWKSLYELYLAQKPRNNLGLNILFGFGGNYHWNTHHNPGVHKAPRTLRERCYLNMLKERERKPSGAF